MANKKGIPKAEWLLFYNSQEPHIQAMMDKYPPGKYIMTEDAPYGLSCPGQPVTLHAYNDDGTVGVVVRAEEKIPAALEHERMLAEERI